jgi:hypothetical protein
MKAAAVAEVGEVGKPRRKREWPIGTLAFLAVLGGGMMLRSAGVSIPQVAATSVEDEIQRSFTVPEHPKVVVEMFNGSIDVVRGQTGQVHSLVTRRVSGPDREQAEKDLQKISVTMTQEGDTVTVRARTMGPARLHNAGAKAKLTVPDGTIVRIATSNGPLRVEGVEGPVDARTSNGLVDVKSATGRVSLSSSNGPIRCEASDAIVIAETSNGPIDFHGLLASGQSTFVTSNGPVKVKLPSQLAFHVDAKTSNGKISTDFDFDENTKSKGRALVASVGKEPKVNVKIRTSNGGVRILEED